MIFEILITQGWQYQCFTPILICWWMGKWNTGGIEKQQDCKEEQICVYSYGIIYSFYVPSFSFKSPSSRFLLVLFVLVCCKSITEAFCSSLLG